jgi:hypothetical protein
MPHWFLRSHIILLALLCGCHASPPTVSVVTDLTHEKYETKFTRAYVALDSTGDYVVVLQQDAPPLPDSGPAGKVLQPTPSLHQVVVIRLLWQPMSGAKPDSPAATNAAVHWYVLSFPTADGTSYLHYAGTAFVRVSPTSTGGDVIIRNGSLKIVDRHGNLIDPLKSFQLNGDFSATADDTQLHQILNDVKSSMAGAKTGPANLPDSQPPARPVGP